jgi:hypothetical protein
MLEQSVHICKADIPAGFYELFILCSSNLCICVKLTLLPSSMSWLFYALTTVYVFGGGRANMINSSAKQLSAG